jgi:uncharacterized protein
MNFLELAEQIITKEREPLSANTVWERAVEFGLNNQLKTTGKTPKATLGARLYKK